jgi:hypothetical protein
MTDNNIEQVDTLLKRVLATGTLNKKELTLLKRTLSSKKHIIQDGICIAKKELLELKESLQEVDDLLEKLDCLEVV